MAAMNERLAHADVLVIGFEEVDRLRELKHRIESPFRFASDPDRHAYAAFGLGRARWLRTYLNPGVISGYARMIVSGDLPRLRRHQDRRQLGGDFVLDASVSIVFARPEKGPEDRAPVAAIVQAVEREKRRG